MSVFRDLFFSMYTHARSWCNTRAVVLKSGCFDGASFFLLLLVDAFVSLCFLSVTDQVVGRMKK